MLLILTKMLDCESLVRVQPIIGFIDHLLPITDLLNQCIFGPDMKTFWRGIMMQKKKLKMNQNYKIRSEVYCFSALISLCTAKCTV